MKEPQAERIEDLAGVRLRRLVQGWTWLQVQRPYNGKSRKEDENQGTMAQESMGSRPPLLASSHGQQTRYRRDISK
jgi:hypothetical protein